MATIRPIIAFFVLLCVCGSIQAASPIDHNRQVIQNQSNVWSPDNGDGTYTNPVLYADYSDPDVCVAGEDYYLTASSFNCIPGLPILHSEDLVNWTIIGHALKALSPQTLFALPQHGKGVWAPAIRHNNGKFYIYWGDPDFGIFMVQAQHPAGPWSEPVCILSGKGMIDPCPLWDDDGRCYLVHAWAASRVGFNSLLTVRELSAEGTCAIGEPVLVFDGGQQNHTTEGPKFYRHDGYYWIMCPAGGVEHGWQLALRSRSPYGPYEWKKIMAQGATSVNGPHQGAWVHTLQGEDWFLHFNDKGAYGRVVFLQPMTWKNGWPMAGVPSKTQTTDDDTFCGEPVMTYRKPKSNSQTIANPQESDEFDTPMLGKQWQWQANYNPTYGMPTTNGYLRLYTLQERTNLWRSPSLLLQKLPAPRFMATAKLRFAAKEEGQRAGIVMMGMDYAALIIERRNQTFVIRRLDCRDADQGGTETFRDVALFPPSARDTIPYSPANYLDLYLRMTVEQGICTFSYSQDNAIFTNVDGSFTMRKGKWMGAKMGLMATSDRQSSNRGWADVDWFRVESLQSPLKKNALDYCHAQVQRALELLQPYDFSMEPRNILFTDEQRGWNLRKATAEEWCSGFWPGILWMDFGYTKNETVRKAAEGYTQSLAYLAESPVYDHDLGFIIINSFLKGYGQTKNEQYKQIALRAADTLATLFNPRVGTLLSWPRHVKEYGGHNTIMDNMINLELLFWAAEHGGDRRLKEMAVSHATTTMHHHFRPDGSCYHVAVYDTLSGKFIQGVTHQGYADRSMWSRGQAWAIYGYTMVYRYTRAPVFLNFAQKVADIYLKRLRETSDDYVPLWDMDDPRGVEAPKDASAACIVASALLELSQYVMENSSRNANGQSVNRKYYDAAVRMLSDLSTPRYQSGDRNVSFLLHSTGHHPAGTEIDASIVYADYYYLEALTRLKH